MYTALDTVIVIGQRALTPITTSVRRRESSGFSEAFHHALRWDGVASADLRSVAAVLPQFRCNAPPMTTTSLCTRSSGCGAQWSTADGASEIQSVYVSECLTNPIALQDERPQPR